MRFTTLRGHDSRKVDFSPVDAPVDGRDHRNPFRSLRDPTPSNTRHPDMSAKRKQPDKGSQPQPAAKAKSASKPTKSKSKTGVPAKGATRAKPVGAKPDQMPPEVLEFIQAIDTYKRLNQRPFPNWSEILEILKGLGYEKSLT